MESGTKEVFTLVGVILSFIVGSAGLLVGIRNSRKTIFINSVTAARIEYLQNLRNNISEFCGLMYSFYAPNVPKVLGSEEEQIALSSIQTKNEIEIQRRYDVLKYLIRLQLNVEDGYFDPAIIRLIDEIRNLSAEEIHKNGAVLTDKLNELVLISQYLFKLEWEGAKLESQKGNISKEAKRDLYNHYEFLHRKKTNNLISNITEMVKKYNLTQTQRTLIILAIILGSIMIGIGTQLFHVCSGIFIGSGVGLISASFLTIYLNKEYPKEK